MTDRFSNHLRNLGRSIWLAQSQHPFIRGIGNGTLEIKNLEYWVEQDYLYLIDFAQVYYLASSRTNDPTVSQWLLSQSEFTLHKELALHLSYAKDLGIGRDKLRKTTKSPTCQAYTDFLIRTAAVEPFSVTIAALLPCFWGYYELGLGLEEKGLPDNELYARWILQYTDPDYAKEVEYCKGLIDTLGAEANNCLIEQMERAFITSSRYEYLFWEMCYKLEMWPV